MPGLLVVLIAALLLWRFPDQLETITSRYALLAYALGLVLAASFHRSRVVLALIALAVVDLSAAPEPSAADPLLPLGTMMVAMLGVLALIRDRGVKSQAGLIQVAIGVGVAGGAYAVFSDPAVVAAFSAVQLMPPGLPAMAALPQATLVIGAAAVLASIYAALRWRGPVERALLWTQLLILVAMLPAFGPAGSGILLMAGGVVLSLSVLEQSYSMAYRDELTGLPARRALMHELADIGGTYTVAMVDVDHFKKFNDKHGHDVGDQVLKLVATKLEAGPGGGKAFRYGGEEFTLLYPGRVREDALPHAEAVRTAVEDATFALRSWNRPRKKPEDKGGPKKTRKARQLSVTVSIGLADTRGEDASPEAVLKRADEALYRAKEGGRNRVAV